MSESEGLKILVVEDDDITGAILQSMLQRFGECDLVSDGEIGLAAMANATEAGDSYDLICLDIILPGLSGQRVLEAIRDREKREGVGRADGVKIIMCTGIEESDDVLSAFHNQCDAYLVKPIEQGNLQGMLVELGLLPASVPGH